MFYFRAFLAVFWFILCSILGTLYSIFNWGNLDIDKNFARVFSWGVLKILGIRVEVEGREYLNIRQPCIYVANHQSNLDMATFGGVYPQRTVVIGKKELHWIPFFGIFFVAAGNITIDRKRTHKAVAGLSQAVETIKKKNVSIWIFPEGTRNRGEGLLPFKRGAFHMALQAGIPIVPLVSEPLYPFVSWKKRLIKGGIYRIKVLPPVETASISPDTSKERVDQLMIEVRNKMLEAFRGLVASKTELQPKPVFEYHP